MQILASITNSDRSAGIKTARDITQYETNFPDEIRPTFTPPTIHRKASCTCGGGCLACQAKSGELRISQPNDAAEIEADHVADRVMRMSVGDMKPTSNSANNSNTIN